MTLLLVLIESLKNLFTKMCNSRDMPGAGYGELKKVARFMVTTRLPINFPPELNSSAQNYRVERSSGPSSRQSHRFMHVYACQLMLEQSHLGVEVLNPPTPPRCSVRIGWTASRISSSDVPSLSLPWVGMASLLESEPQLFLQRRFR